MNLIKNCRYGMMIYNNSDVWVGRSIEKFGEFSESEVQVFRDAIKEGDVVLDVGANIGCHTVAFSRLVGNAGLVYAFEPERLNFNTMCGNIAINNIMNVFPYQKAVGSNSGFILVPELDQNLTVNFGGLTLIGDYSKCPNYKVEIIKIDDMSFSKLNFIKMDIEGMERFAIEGAKNTINQFKPILYVEDDREENHAELIGLLKSINYKCYKHLAPMFNPENYYKNKENVFLVSNDQGGLNQIVSGNLFCHHKDVECPIDTNKFSMIEI
jgi:FkbM family methyltransferase